MIEDFDETRFASCVWYFDLAYYGVIYGLSFMQVTQSVYIYMSKAHFEAAEFKEKVLPVLRVRMDFSCRIYIPRIMTKFAFFKEAANSGSVCLYLENMFPKLYYYYGGP